MSTPWFLGDGNPDPCHDEARLDSLSRWLCTSIAAAVRERSAPVAAVFGVEVQVVEPSEAEVSSVKEMLRWLSPHGFKMLVEIQESNPEGLSKARLFARNLDQLFIKITQPGAAELGALGLPIIAQPRG